MQKSLSSVVHWIKQFFILNITRKQSKFNISCLQQQEELDLQTRKSDQTPGRCCVESIRTRRNQTLAQSGSHRRFARYFVSFFWKMISCAWILNWLSGNYLAGICIPLIDHFPLIGRYWPIGVPSNGHKTFVMMVTTSQTLSFWVQ